MTLERYFEEHKKSPMQQQNNFSPPYQITSERQQLEQDGCCDNNNHPDEVFSYEVIDSSTRDLHNQGQTMQTTDAKPREQAP